MEREFPESDWKTSRELRQVALERFCKRVLEEVPQFPPDTGRSYHERYLKLFRWLGERNDDLAQFAAQRGVEADEAEMIRTKPSSGGMAWPSLLSPRSTPRGGGYFGRRTASGCYPGVTPSR